MHLGSYSELFGDGERALVEAAAGEWLIEVEHLSRPGETALVFSESLRDAVLCRVVAAAVTAALETPRVTSHRSHATTMASTQSAKRIHAGCGRGKRKSELVCRM